MNARRLGRQRRHDGRTATIDLLDVEDGRVAPVDIKTGKRPHVVEGAYLPERVQVCVQGLLPREAGYLCDESALWFARVAFTDDLVATTLRAATELRLAVAANRILPPPLDNSPKCPRCSLLLICLPDEVACLSRGQVPPAPGPN